MLELLVAAGLEGKPTIEKCRALRAEKQAKKEKDEQVKKESKIKREDSGE